MEILARAGNTKGGSITVQLTSCLTGLDWSVLQIKRKIVSCHTPDSKLFKQEVNGTVILPPLVFPGQGQTHYPLVPSINLKFELPVTLFKLFHFIDKN